MEEDNNATTSEGRKLVYALVYGHFWSLKRFPGEAKIINLAAADLFCSVMEEHDESSRMPVCTWWLDPRPGVFYRRPKPPNCPTRRWSPARPFCRFVVPGEGGTAQCRSQTERKNKRRAPGVFISYHGSCRRLARANLAKILSCRIDPPTSLVYGGWHGKGRGKKKQSPGMPGWAR